MPNLQYWRGVWRRAKEYGDYHNFPKEIAPVVDRFAEAAYKYCVHLYGSPRNAKKGYKVVQGKHSFYCPLPTPIITISGELESQEHLCMTIAHEMYHRVTEGRKGIANELWVKEMLASLTSCWFLSNQGFQDYVKASRRAIIAVESAADIHLLRRSSSATWRYVWFDVPVYSEGFSNSVWRIGYALNRVVKGNDLCTLVKFATLEAWIASLPAEDQYAVCRLLALPTKDKAIPCGNKELSNLYYALQAKGDKEALTAEFKHLADLQPTNGEVFFYLGYAHQEAKIYEDALSAYTKAQELGYIDKWLIYNIGSVYWRMEDYALAAEWFQRATEQAPDWAQPLYFLGRSLNNLNNIEAARQNWEKVLTLSDEHYTKLAQTALDENPSPHIDSS
ncbi:MAG: tetratricopeptide repeat protein [Janthinobacterium lividum]